MKILLLQVTRNALYLTPVKSGRRPTFGNPRNFKLPEVLKTDGAFNHTAQFAKFVRECVYLAKFRTKNIMICLEDANMISKEYPHLPLKGRNLNQFARLEAESVISDNISDYSIQNYEYGLINPATGKLTSSLFAVKSSLIHSISRSFSKYGLHVLKITPPVIGLLHSARSFISSTEKTVAVLDFSLSKTNLLVLRNGYPIFQRSFEAIYDDVLEILMKSRSLSYEDAAAWIARNGLTGSGEGEGEEAEQIEALVDASASEVIRNIRMVISRERLELNKIVFCGALSVLPNFTAFWNQLGLDIPLETVETDVATSGLPMVDESAKAAGYSAGAFFAAAGLLNHLKFTSIDFLKEIRAVEFSTKVNITVIAVVSLTAMFVMTLEPLLYFQRVAQNAKSSKDIKKYTDIQKLLATQKSLTDRLSAFSTEKNQLPYGKSKAYPAAEQLFNQIASKALSLEAFDIDNTSGTISVSFKVQSYNSFLEIKRAIQSNAYFTIAVPFKVTLNNDNTYSCETALGWKDYVKFIDSKSSKDGGKE